MESSGNKQTRTELEFLINENVKYLAWPKRKFSFTEKGRFTDLIDIIIKSKNKKAIDQLSRLIHDAIEETSNDRDEDEEDDKRQILKCAWSYMVDQIMEIELGKKYPSFSKIMKEEIEILYGVS